MIAESNAGTVKSADRALEVLEVLADAPGPMSLNELAQRMHVPKSSLHAILRTMVQRQWVESDDSTRFRLGLRTLLVGARYVDANDMLSLVQPTLDWLASELGETVHFGRLDGPDVVYLAKRESKHPLRLYSAIGRRLPAHATALGKAILSKLRPSEVVEILPEQLPSLTPATITDHARLAAELTETRVRGYAIDNEENAEGIRCFATAISSAEAPYYALSLSIPVFRLNERVTDDAIALLQQAQLRVESQNRLTSAVRPTA